MSVQIHPDEEVRRAIIELTDALTIPECVHPLSKAWDQPKNTEIAIDDTHALMSEESFEQLHEYSMSIPTGVYTGKMWKAHNRLNDEWYLRWYEEGPLGSGTCRIKSRLVLVVEQREVDGKS